MGSRNLDTLLQPYRKAAKRPRAKTKAPAPPVFDAAVGQFGVERTFWMSYAVTKVEGGKIKIEGYPPMSMVEARQLMHRIVDFGADQLIGRFGFGATV